MSWFLDTVRVGDLSVSTGFFVARLRFHSFDTFVSWELLSLTLPTRFPLPLKGFRSKGVVPRMWIMLFKACSSAPLHLSLHITLPSLPICLRHKAIHPLPFETWGFQWTQASLESIRACASRCAPCHGSGWLELSSEQTVKNPAIVVVTIRYEKL